MIENMVRILNELLAADPKATNKFFNLGIDVNKQVCDHPTIQVLADRTRMDSAQTGDAGVLRPLGLLNGLLGGDRVIVMMMNASETEITGFTTGTLTDGKVAMDTMTEIVPNTITAEIRDGQVFITAGKKYREFLWNIQDEHKQKFVDTINAAFAAKPDAEEWYDAAAVDRYIEYIATSPLSMDWETIHDLEKRIKQTKIDRRPEILKHSIDDLKTGRAVMSNHDGEYSLTIAGNAAEMERLWKYLKNFDG